MHAEHACEDTHMRGPTTSTRHMHAFAIGLARSGGVRVPKLRVAAALATAAAVMVATACACESPRSARQGYMKRVRAMHTALDVMQGVRKFEGRARTISTSMDAVEEVPVG